MQVHQARSPCQCQRPCPHLQPLLLSLLDLVPQAGVGAQLHGDAVPVVQQELADEGAKHILPSRQARLELLQVVLPLEWLEGVAVVDPGGEVAVEHQLPSHCLGGKLTSRAGKGVLEAQRRLLPAAHLPWSEA